MILHRTRRPRVWKEYYFMLRHYARIYSEATYDAAASCYRRHSLFRKTVLLLARGVWLAQLRELSLQRRDAPIALGKLRCDIGRLATLRNMLRTIRVPSGDGE